MWIWQECENYASQLGSRGIDSKGAASGRQCLGNKWASNATHYAEYKINLLADFEGATFYLRYAAQTGKSKFLSQYPRLNLGAKSDENENTIFDVYLDGKLIGISPSLTLSPTGGWGHLERDWQFANLSLGDISAGEHVITIRSKADDNRTNLDGFFIGDKDFSLPTSFNAFAQTQERKRIEGARRTASRVQFLHLPKIRRQAMVAYPQAIRSIKDSISPDLGYVLEQCAKKPSPYLLKSHDVGLPIDYTASSFRRNSALGSGRIPSTETNDFVWHSLKKEHLFNLPHSGKIGVVNPNSDISFFFGLSIGGQILDYEIPSETKLHLIDLLVEKIEIAEKVNAYVAFVPYTISTLMAVVFLQNENNARREIFLHQYSAKDVEAKPYQRYGKSIFSSTGDIRWAGYDNQNNVTFACYDEWGGGKLANLRVGKLLCALTGSERPVGQIFSSELKPASARLHPIRFVGMKYRFSLMPNSEKIAVFSISLQRYSDQAGTAPGYPQLDDEEAINKVAQDAVKAVNSDWSSIVSASIQKYGSMPKIKLPQESWIADFYAALELPRAETQCYERATAPFIIWECWNTYLWSNDREFLEEAYQAGVKNHEFWLKKRDRSGTGLSHWLDYVETVDGAENQEALDLNCYLYVQEKCLALMAKELGKDDMESFDLAARRRMNTINNYLWHEEDGCYYGRDLVNDKWARVKDISTFMPLWAGIAPNDRSEKLVELLDSPAFNADFPVPTLATNEPTFVSDGHWHGSNWVEMTWLVILGLKKYGYYEKAAELAYVNTKIIFDLLEKTGHFREYYNSQTGTAARNSLYDDIWACLPAVFINQIFFGIEPKIDGLEIMPALPRDWTEISIENLWIRGRSISVAIKRPSEIDRTEVKLNGKPIDVVENRGASIAWEDLTAGAEIEIRQPMVIAEKHGLAEMIEVDLADE